MIGIIKKIVNPVVTIYVGIGPCNGAIAAPEKYSNNSLVPPDHFMD